MIPVSFHLNREEFATVDSTPLPEAEDFPSDYTNTISKALGSFIQSKSATFACGGTIPIKARHCLYLMEVEN
jgi:hypothetical protein